MCKCTRNALKFVSRTMFALCCAVLWLLHFVYSSLHSIVWMPVFCFHFFLLNWCCILTKLLHALSKQQKNAQQTHNIDLHNNLHTVASFLLFWFLPVFSVILNETQKKVCTFKWARNEHAVAVTSTWVKQDFVKSN